MRLKKRSRNFGLPPCCQRASRVVESRIRNGAIHRRRECLDCKKRYRTWETTINPFTVRDSAPRFVEAHSQFIELEQRFKELMVETFGTTESSGFTDHNSGIEL